MGLAPKTLLLLLVTSLAAACSTRPSESARAPARNCDLRVWYKPRSPAAHVEIVGSWTSWTRPGLVVRAEREDGWRVASIPLPPGEARYAVIDDGEWLANPYVATTDEHEGREVTWVDVPSCEAPALDAIVATADGTGTGRVTAQFLTARSGAMLASARLVPRDGSAPVAPSVTNAATGEIAFDLPSLTPGKHSFSLEASDARGLAAEARPVSVWAEAAPFDRRDTIIYQVMLDRFRGPAGALEAPSPPSARAGGTLDGLRAYLATGALQRMGVNTLWLSPIYENPEGLFPGNDGRMYSSYHGYWPKSSRKPDPRIATEASVDAFMADAHARGFRVLFDVVPNHVHDENPAFRDRSSDVGFNITSPRCICGIGDCDWGRHILDCWFAPYMPDIDWRVPDAARRGVDDVAFWLDRFDADGVRIDAVPMMPRSATRRITARLRERFQHDGHPLFLLGENFTGPDGFASLRYHLGPFGLDSLFHFPLMWALRSAVAHESVGLDAVAEAVAQGEVAFQGAGAVMGTFIGNHDVTRFATEASGASIPDGWTAVPQPPDAIVYTKQKLALGLVFTLPGAPVVYYGDEVGLAGGGDPDSRRVYPKEADLTALQRDVRAFTERLGTIRACIPALRRGNYTLLASSAEVYAFARGSEGAEPVAVVAVRDVKETTRVNLQGLPTGEYVDLLTGAKASLPGELTNPALAPFSLQIFVPVSSACRKLAP